MKIKAFIINFNRLDLPRNMADYLIDCDVEPVIVDNNSTYPPLLEYYKTCPHKVERLNSNMGNNAVFLSGVLDKYGLNESRFIMTDPDLDLFGIPKDFLHILHLGLDRHSFATKAGFSLEINDLPDTEIKSKVLEWEAGNWSKRLDEYFISAYIDTTFALYRRCFMDFPAVRTVRPYTAKHVPWYYTKGNIPEDELYYLNECHKLNAITCYTELIYKMIN